MELGWVMMWLCCLLYTCHAVMTGPMRAEAAGEGRPPGFTSVLSSAKLAVPLALALCLAAWPEMDHTATVPAAVPTHAMIGVAASGLGAGVAMVLLRWRKWRLLK